MRELIHRDEVYLIVGAAMAVYNELGSGFAEAVYQEALQIELAARGISFAAQVPLRISYRGQMLSSKYFADLVCFGSVIVELKAQRNLEGYEEAQVLNYLKATGLRVAVVINFGDPSELKWKRYVI
ncbi:MAG: GxxExxY protein [Tepidisphaeraceae bacterium]